MARFVMAPDIPIRKTPYVTYEAGREGSEFGLKKLFVQRPNNSER